MSFMDNWASSFGVRREAEKLVAILLWEFVRLLSKLAKFENVNVRTWKKVFGIVLFFTFLSLLNKSVVISYL